MKLFGLTMFYLVHGKIINARVITLEFKFLFWSGDGVMSKKVRNVEPCSPPLMRKSFVLDIHKNWTPQINWQNEQEKKNSGRVTDQPIMFWNCQHETEMPSSYMPKYLFNQLNWTFGQFVVFCWYIFVLCAECIIWIWWVNN